MSTLARLFEFIGRPSCAGLVEWGISRFVRGDTGAISIQGFSFQASTVAAGVAVTSSLTGQFVGNLFIPFLLRSFPTGLSQFISNFSMPIGAAGAAFGLSYIPGMEPLLNRRGGNNLTARAMFAAEIGVSDFAGGALYQQFKRPLLAGFVPGLRP